MTQSLADTSRRLHRPNAKLISLALGATLALAAASASAESMDQTTNLPQQVGTSAAQAGYSAADASAIQTAVETALAGGVTPEAALALAQAAIAAHVDAAALSGAFGAIADGIKAGAFSDVANTAARGLHPQYDVLSADLLTATAQRFAQSLVDNGSGVGGAISDDAGWGKSFWSAALTLDQDSA